MASEELCHVSFACNDERGRPTGEFYHADFETAGKVLSMAGSENSARIKWKHLSIRVAGREYQTSTVPSMYEGNLCWNGVDMPLLSAKALACHLLENCGFFVESCDDLHRMVEVTNAK